jgi:hypothetical protein
MGIGEFNPLKHQIAPTYVLRFDFQIDTAPQHLAETCSVFLKIR